ncbi:peptide hydrolase [Trypanosoma cruzi]|nr:peptide hydrolase [Trypanosoma cruzi]
MSCVRNAGSEVRPKSMKRSVGSCSAFGARASTRPNRQREVQPGRPPDANDCARPGGRQRLRKRPHSTHVWPERWRRTRENFVPLLLCQNGRPSGGRKRARHGGIEMRSPKIALGRLGDYLPSLVRRASSGRA